MKWRRFRQRLCWILGGRDEWDCYYAVHSSWPGELICEDCEHNRWRRMVNKCKAGDTVYVKCEVIRINEEGDPVIKLPDWGNHIAVSENDLRKNL